MAARMMMEDGKLRTEEQRENDCFNNSIYHVPLKRFGLYCAAVCRSGGKACIGVGVGSDK